MAILPISGATLNAGKCTFSGRRDKNNDAWVSSEQSQYNTKASKLKTAPVVLMMALAPMSAVSQQNYQADKFETAQVTNTKKKDASIDLLAALIKLESKQVAKANNRAKQANNNFGIPANIVAKLGIKKLVDVVPCKDLQSGESAKLLYLKNRSREGAVVDNIAYLPNEIPYSNLAKHDAGIPSVKGLTINYVGSYGVPVAVLSLSQMVSHEDKPNSVYVHEYEVVVDMEIAEKLMDLIDNNTKYQNESSIKYQRKASSKVDVLAPGNVVYEITSGY